MENDILDSLKDVGYSLDDVGLQKSVAEGPKSASYTKLVEWITNELQFLYSLDEHVNAITSPEDSSSFLMELSSFLKEIGCQYGVLTEGHVNERLRSKQSRLLLLDYLLTELKAARMVQANKPDTELQVTLDESSTATDLKKMLMVMNFPKPPNNIPPSVLFGKVQAKLKEIISQVPQSLVGNPLLKSNLTEKQWESLAELQKDLHAEYKMRREMLLKRLDVTVQSFEWSDRLKGKSSDIKGTFESVRKGMSAEPGVRLSDILAAREDLAILEKTSSASVRRKTQSDVNRVLIGMVPDRGGRPYEQEPPPPEMPSWQQRNTGPGGRGGGRGGGGGVRGGGGGRGGGFSGGRGGGSGGGNFAGDSNFNRSGSGRGYESGPSSAGSGRVQAGWNANQSRGGGYDKGSSQYSQSGGYDNRSGGYDNRSGGYDNRSGGYDNRSGGYDNRSGGYSNRPGGYDNRSGGYDSRSGGYENRQGDYNSRSYDSRGSSRGGYQSRGGYGQRNY